jgi:imidazolonepropionase
LDVPELVITNARILTLAGSDEPRRGEAMRDLRPIDRGHVVIEQGRITKLAPGDYVAAEDEDSEVLDVGGCVVMPTFVDCHTHACFAGSRLDEFLMAIEGRPYLEILKAGGGIMSTVRATREAPADVLEELLLHRLMNMALLGTGTVEVKSGYGLNTETELKMLRAVHSAAQLAPLSVVGTFLGAHAIDRDNPEFIEQTIKETLPTVESEFPEIVCDAYCEDGAWSLSDCRRLFEAAMEMGCPIRVHTDQFNSLGMTSWAIDMQAISVDHLEAITQADITRLAASQTIGVVLPCSGFQLDGRYAPARAMIDAGAAIAIATNYNPGSAPSPSMPFSIALACRKMKLTPAEAITAATHNAACVLRAQHRAGSLQVGRRADLQVLECADERELAYELAGPGPLMVVLNGHTIRMRSAGEEESQ